MKHAAAIFLAALTACTVAYASDGWRTIEARGVSLRVAPDWQRVRRADPGNVADPRTVLVTGTRGAGPIASDCQVASYRVPEEGAVVVVIGWRTKPTFSVLDGRESLTVGRLRTGYFQCFEGRGIAAYVTFDGRAFQVNVMVGGEAPRGVVLEALATARSLERAH